VPRFGANVIYLIRHGESIWNAQGRVQGWSDPRLSRAGLAQGEAVARRLAALPLARLYTSPLRRAAQTARVIAEASETSARPVAEFREIGLGVWEGMPVWSLRRRYPTLYETWLRTPSKAQIPQGEGIARFRRRVAAAFRMVLEETPAGATAVIVTHGGVIRVIVAAVLGIPFDLLTRGISLGNASVTRLTRTRGRLAVAVLNDTSHLHGAR